jgi:hypothetical protein
VDETYLSIKAKWHYLYRAVDKYGKKESTICSGTTAGLRLRKRSFETLWRRQLRVGGAK